MKKESFIRKILFVGLLLVFFSCDKDEYTNNSPEGTASATKGTVNQIVYGDKVEVGNGLVNSFMIFDEFGKPLELGIIMTKDVLDNLPPDSDFEKPAVIPLPKNASDFTAFNHIELNYNPDNYSKIPGFKRAHFGVYFYMISENDRMEIPAWSDEAEAKFAFYPPKNYMPNDFSPLQKGSGSFATMGRHWLNIYEGDLEAYTLRLGTYNGNFVFINPVVTLDFLKTGKKVNTSFSQGINNPLNNMLPREYTIYTDEVGNHYISLGNFISR